MSKGNISLTLLNVREEDAGIYTCLVPKLGSKVKQDTVTLVVGNTLAAGGFSVQQMAAASFWSLRFTAHRCFCLCF
ncbi:unnamed protein product [Menidia menidia]|uniref:(Atlantic silverside) hypothetical protein n=1 Tax=Menidia menidia TaxID=238744 RepID=A0A8S4BJ90_9TELE|nr:unnamed protein product [Menidia menidia]